MKGIICLKYFLIGDNLTKLCLCMCPDPYVLGAGQIGAWHGAWHGVWYDTTPNTSSPLPTRPLTTPKSNITNPGSTHMKLSHPHLTITTATTTTPYTTPCTMQCTDPFTVRLVCHNIPNPTRTQHIRNGTT